MTSNVNWSLLSGELAGFVALPGDSAYTASLQIDNGRIQLHPAAVVFPFVETDVARAIKFARDHKIAMTAKGGGHSAAGYCLNRGGMVIDLQYMNAIEFNRADETVRVQLGARWREVYILMEATGTGLFPVGGGCPTVGVPGFMLGGGYSFVSRSYGMSIDSLHSIKLVTPDGELRHIGIHSTSQADKDLFWACCGGGGGNFGIAVEMVMRVRRPHSAKMLCGQLRYPLSQAREILAYYNDWAAKVPDAMACYGYVGQMPASENYPEQLATIGLTPVFNGKSKDGMELLRGFLDMSPLVARLYEMTLPQWEAFNGNATLVNNKFAYIRSAMLKPRGMTDAIAKTLIKYLSDPPSKDSFMVWTHGLGQITAVGNADTAFAHRDAGFIPEVKSIWDASRPGDMEKNVRWAYDFFEEMSKEATGAYVNYIDPLLHDWDKKYYAANYDRLLAIKKTVDPDRMFHFQQGVGSKFNPTAALTDLSPLNRTL
jgi:FAD/FMN-containing dehydrogenase